MLKVVVRITRVANLLIPSATKVAQNVFSNRHVVLSWKVLSWKVHILTECKMCKSKSRARRCNKIS